jgi:hypothetical protein
VQIRKRKTLTPAERIEAANQQTSTALFVFEQAAVSLDMAASDFQAIDADLQAEAEAKRIEAREISRRLRSEAYALENQATVAFERSEQAIEQAETIRGLLGIATGNA